MFVKRSVNLSCSSMPSELFASLCVFAVASQGASLVPTRLFGNNMVLQASKTQPAVLFGTAEAGAVVELRDTSTFHPRASYSARADASGSWLIEMEPYEVLKGDPNLFTLTLSSEGTADATTAVNVSYGDVFLCSGQSNMELSLGPIYDNVTIINNAHHPEIRLLQVPPTASPEPSEALPPTTVGWNQTTPQSIPKFSAVCYLTTLALQRARAGGPMAGRVYGLIKSAVGSTDVQSWMSAQARARALDCWLPRAAELPPSHSHAPTNGTAASELWNAMIKPIVPFSLRAMLWDQGENNAGYATREQYNCLFSSMVQSWRSAFRAPQLPVAAVQIGGYSWSNPHTTNWGIRFAQSDALPADTRLLFSNSSRIPVENAAMAPTFDLGSPEPGNPAGTWWIHCRNKTEVGRRLALQLSNLLGEIDDDSGEYSGPVVRSVALSLGADQRPYVDIAMDHAAGLRLSPAQGCVQCCDQSVTRTPTTPTLFGVQNRKGVWLNATGQVIPDPANPAQSIVRVSPASNVTGDWILSVRYAVLDIPQCALYNDAEIPAAQFDFPVGWSAPQAAAASYSSNSD